ncbi:hypothetical protein CHX26_11160 [Porphyrobacter sp. HT-58-2]|uniref:hypothetical protein n=1 Tax=Porphyrobacter sp. HT-58-2 TaxID=2023229 RepID=UPI000CDC7B17|nr:hypothetical protein [Porphyrobacter sp. HT-58-2]AUX69973.1 hypothetical protein CHX26_11160 [Porphyrobacter sp. HT-58-2]
MTHYSSPRHSVSLARQFALALALAGGTAVLAVPGMTDAAFAQKKKKDDKKDAGKPVYSKEFVEAYKPIEEAMKGGAPDFVALKPLILALAPLSISPDEQIAAGGLLFNTGVTTEDQVVQLQGVEMMLNSGKIAPAEVGRFQVVAFQVASNLEQYDRARAHLQKAIDLGYLGTNMKPGDLEMNMAETYFSEERFQEGLQYLMDSISQRKAQGGVIDERWYRRGFSVAYSNEVVPQVYDYLAAWVVDFPTEQNWRDAVNATRNLNEFEPQAMLDLLRLGRRVDMLQNNMDYILYIESADARRLPMEVKTVIEEARAKGLVPKGSDTFVDEQMGIATGRIAADRAELPTLERDANASTTNFRLVVGAADAFLNYGDYAKAAAFYEKALGIAGVDRNLVLTRLGIAQVLAGDMAAARENFAKVEGVRASIAKLWSAYATQKAAPAAAPMAAPAEMAGD